MRRRDLLFSSLLTGSTMPLAAQAPVRGRLVIVGGAEDRVQDRLILRRFLQYAGGPQARIRLLAAASAVPLVVAESYRRAFAEIGTGGCELLPLLERDAAFLPDTVQAILDADAIFISGGNQSRLMDVLRDTPAMAALQHAHRHLGCCIGGTSAGAAAMSRHMIAQGLAVRHPRKDAVGTGIGLGLLPAAIVDQHFSERGGSRACSRRLPSGPTCSAWEWTRTLPSSSKARRRSKSSAVAPSRSWTPLPRTPTSASSRPRARSRCWGCSCTRCRRAAATRRSRLRKTRRDRRGCWPRCSGSSRPRRRSPDGARGTAEREHRPRPRVASFAGVAPGSSDLDRTARR
jgi:cyanophycinase